MSDLRLALLGTLLLASSAYAGAAAPPGEWTGVVNLNAATPEQLDALPGVGARAAEKIIAYRAKRPFARVEELVRVKGFGKKKFLKLKPLLSVAGPTTLQRKSAESRAPVAAVR